jgi:glutathione S-transferase
MNMGDLILHEYAASGNCYKIRLTAALLGLPIERREYDIMKGETRTAGFLASVNANGRIPVLQIGDLFLPESNAACFYLVDGSPLIPADRFDRADMLRWMFWEQYNHEPNVATLRFWFAFVGEANLSEVQRAQLPAKKIAGGPALLRGRRRHARRYRPLRLHPCR